MKTNRILSLKRMCKRKEQIELQGLSFQELLWENQSWQRRLEIVKDMEDSDHEDYIAVFNTVKRLVGIKKLQIASQMILNSAEASFSETEEEIQRRIVTIMALFDDVLPELSEVNEQLMALRTAIDEEAANAVDSVAQLSGVSE